MALWFGHLIRLAIYPALSNSSAKRLPGLKNVAYRDRLAITNLETLEFRRLYADLVMCYKIVFRLINVDFYTFFRLAPSNKSWSPL